MAEQVAQKAGRVHWLLSRLLSLLLRLLQLLLQLGHLGPGLIQRNILHQHRLRHYVQRVWIAAKPLIQQRFCVRIFFLQLCLIDSLDERV
jgi:hypothetical protein